MIRRYAKTGGVVIPLSPLLEVPKPIMRYPAVSGTTPAVAYADGTWVEAIASAPSDVSHIKAQLTVSSALSNTSSGMFLEIGFGDSGSEIQVAVFDVSARLAGAEVINIPFPIPAGTRVSVRMRSSRLTTAWGLNLTAYSLDIVPTNLPIEIAHNPATCTGVALASPGTNDGVTYGAWTEITASTSNEFVGLHNEIAINKQSNSNTALLHVQIGVGAAGAEVVIYDNWLTTTPSESITEVEALLAPALIPAGSRIAARYTRTANTSCSVALNGVRV